MSVYEKFRDYKTAGSLSCRHTLTGRGKSPFHPRSRCFVSAWVIDLRKNTGLFTVQKVPFLRSTIYPANFGTFNGHLELVPSGISPFLVFFWPSIRRYLSGTHNWLIYRFSQGWKRSFRFYTYDESNQIEVITWTLSQKTEIFTSLRAFGIGHLYLSPELKKLLNCRSLK